MKNGQQLLQRLADGAELSGEPIPGGTLVEIAGDSRVLVENHFGISQYSAERICVKVKFGMIQICGCGLELIRMTKEQLIVSGRIAQVCLIRRGR